MMFEDMPVVSSYTWKQAVEDGVLVELFKNRWPEISGDKPLLATIAIYNAFSLAALQEIWNEYVVWAKNVMLTLPESERMFVTKMNDQKVWVIWDETVFTILFPSDY